MRHVRSSWFKNDSPKTCTSCGVVDYRISNAARCITCGYITKNKRKRIRKTKVRNAILAAISAKRKIVVNRLTH